MTITFNNGNEQAFWTAIKNVDVETANRLLNNDNSLAGKNFQPDSLHTDGFPLYQATKTGNFELVKILLDAGADPDAKLETDNPRESGMPLLNAFEQANNSGSGHFDVVYLILQYEPNLDAYPYCSTPFVDCLFNNMWATESTYQPGKAWEYKHDSAQKVAQLFREAYVNYLQPEAAREKRRLPTSLWVKCPDCDATVFKTKEVRETNTCSTCGGNLDFQRSGEDLPELELLLQVVEMGGQPSLFTLVRHQQHELIEELLRKCPAEKGTRMDWPQGRVFDNIKGAGAWCGYPKTVAACMAHCQALYTNDVARHSIENAIRSHNRDGDIDQYFELIESQLKFLQETLALGERYDNGNPFCPLHWLSEDFIEPSHYGFKCDRLGTEADVIRLANLFIEYGFDVNSVNSKSDLTPVETARKLGLQDVARFLVEQI